MRILWLLAFVGLAAVWFNTSSKSNYSAQAHVGYISDITVESSPLGDSVVFVQVTGDQDDRANPNNPWCVDEPQSDLRKLTIGQRVQFDFYHGDSTQIRIVAIH